MRDAVYRREIRVEMNHCDPAGIVFYPRYIEMASAVTESFFHEILDSSYAAMMAEGRGIPTAALQASYLRPSRLGEMLDWRLWPERLGRSSLALRIEAHGAGEHRFTLEKTVVFAGFPGGPEPWPDPLRQRLAALLPPV